LRPHLTAIEGGDDGGSIGAIARVAAVLGADLSARLYPTSGPAIHDRIQARIGDALVAMLDKRWRVYPEVPVRTPTPGRIDFVLFDAETAVAIVTEIESGLRRVEQQIGWHRLKAEALPSSPIWPDVVDGDSGPTIHRLLVVRSTRDTRGLAQQLAGTLLAAYPATSRDVRAALTSSASWPGPGVLGVSVHGSVVRFDPRISTTPHPTRHHC
jgi:hypothetical protein